jgi:hypothetical protein
VATELITPEEAAVLDAHAPPVALMLSLGSVFSVPPNIHASNVRTMREGVIDGTISHLCCDGVVTREPLVSGQKLVLVESIATLLGFYNNGVDADGAPIIVAAYGKPFLHRAFDVTVGPAMPPISYTSSLHYETVVLHVVSMRRPKSEPPESK